MDSITIDLVNKNALKLLQDLELLDIIKLHNGNPVIAALPIPWITKYKGSMSKQSVSEIDRQLNELRSAWE